MKKILVFLIILIVIFAYIANQAGYIPTAERPEEVEIFIPMGSSARKVVKILGKADVARNSAILSYYLSYTGIDSRLKSGHYVFYKDSNVKDISDILEKGPVLTTKWLTIPEGYTLKKIGERISGKGKLKKFKFDELVGNPGSFSKYAFLKDPKIKSLEGYLFPQTYKIDVNTDTQALVKLMLDQFEAETENLSWGIAAVKELTRHEIVVIASLIEREAKIPAERPLVASVIYNRLAIGMPLQIDATVQYALPNWKDRLLYKDLEVKSPYNTYRNKGLPPGPICSPGIESIKAALAPASTKYLYYVLKDDQGNHFFAETYKEFLEAKRKRKRT